jgi:hypothetical protein
VSTLKQYRLPLAMIGLVAITAIGLGGFFFVLVKGYIPFTGPNAVRGDTYTPPPPPEAPPKPAIVTRTIALVLAASKDKEPANKDKGPANKGKEPVNKDKEAANKDKDKDKVPEKTPSAESVTEGLKKLRGVQQASVKSNDPITVELTMEKPVNLLAINKCLTEHKAQLVEDQCRLDGSLLLLVSGITDEESFNLVKEALSRIEKLKIKKNTPLHNEKKEPVGQAILIELEEGTSMTLADLKKPIDSIKVKPEMKPAMKPAARTPPGMRGAPPSGAPPKRFKLEDVVWVVSPNPKVATSSEKPGGE